MLPEVEAVLSRALELLQQVSPFTAYFSCAVQPLGRFPGLGKTEGSYRIAEETMQLEKQSDAGAGS